MIRSWRVWTSHGIWYLLARSDVLGTQLSLFYLRRLGRRSESRFLRRRLSRRSWSLPFSRSFRFDSRTIGACITVRATSLTAVWLSRTFDFETVTLIACSCFRGLFGVGPGFVNPGVLSIGLIWACSFIALIFVATELPPTWELCICSCEC